MSTLNDSPSEIHIGVDKRAVYWRTGCGLVISALRSLLLARFLVPVEIGAYRLVTSWGDISAFLLLGPLTHFIFLYRVLLEMEKMPK